MQLGTILFFAQLRIF